MGLFWSYYKWGVRCFICKKWFKFSRRNHVRRKYFQEDHNEFHKEFFKDEEQIINYILSIQERIELKAYKIKPNYSNVIKSLGINVEKAKIGNKFCFFCKNACDRKNQIICDNCIKIYSETINFEKIVILVDNKRYFNSQVNELISILLKDKIELIEQTEDKTEGEIIKEIESRPKFMNKTLLEFVSNRSKIIE